MRPLVAFCLTCVYLKQMFVYTINQLNNRMKAEEIKWSTDHYEGYSKKTMLIGDYNGHRSISDYNNNHWFPFAQISLWWAKKLIYWELKALSSKTSIN